jgi:hypothetical protein
MTYEAVSVAQKKWYAAVHELLGARGGWEDAAYDKQQALYEEYSKTFQDWCGMTLEEVEDMGDT